MEDIFLTIPITKEIVSVPFGKRFGKFMHRLGYEVVEEAIEGELYLSIPTKSVAETGFSTPTANHLPDIRSQTQLKVLEKKRGSTFRIIYETDVEHFYKKTTGFIGTHFIRVFAEIPVCQKN